MLAGKRFLVWLARFERAHFSGGRYYLLTFAHTIFGRPYRKSRLRDLPLSVQARALEVCSPLPVLPQP